MDRINALHMGIILMICFFILFLLLILVLVRHRFPFSTWESQANALDIQTSEWDSIILASIINNDHTLFWSKTLNYKWHLIFETGRTNKIRTTHSALYAAAATAAPQPSCVLGHSQRIFIDIYEVMRSSKLVSVRFASFAINTMAFLWRRLNPMKNAFIRNLSFREFFNFRIHCCRCARFDTASE